MDAKQHRLSWETGGYGDISKEGQAELNAPLYGGY